MIDIARFVEYWRDRIERDLSPFCDPGTRLELAGAGRSFLAHWTSRARSMEAAISISVDSGVQVTYRAQTLSYKSFLSSPDLADLLGLAKMILQSQQDSIFVQTKARLADSDGVARQPAVQLLQDLLTAYNSADVTRVVMVTGDAGAGKTRVLKTLVTEQARKYQRGESDCLYLYINAQGRALARFNEALATELQDLRSFVTYHAVSALVRLGILVPVIDGFDELLGVGGYDDAFSSLTGFMEELNGNGQLVASARSSYYEQEFVARASSVSSLGAQSWTQVPVEVLSWEDEEYSQYVDRRASEANYSTVDNELFRARLDSIFSDRNTELRRKPFFVARTVDIALHDTSFEAGGDLLNELVTADLERERLDKLLDKGGGSLLTHEQLEKLFTTLAEEMWNQQTRELDRPSVKYIAEYVLVTEKVPESAQRIVIERMAQLALLTRGEKSGGTAFEHEMFFSFFLAKVFGNALLENLGGVRLMLGRSVLPVEVATGAIAAMDTSGSLLKSGGVPRLLEALNSAVKEEGLRSSQVRENAGVLLSEALKRAGGAGIQVSEAKCGRLVLPGGNLNGVEVLRWEFEGTEFRRVDLTRARFRSCRAQGIVFTDVVVDPGFTRLEFEDLDVATAILGLRIREGDVVKAIYDPKELRALLAACGAVPPPPEGMESERAIAAPYYELVKKLCRAYGRTNPVCTSDDNLRHLFKSQRWPAIEKRLVQHGIVTVETRPTGGPQKRFLRRQFLPEQIMSGADRESQVPEKIRGFWDTMEADFPTR
jgi:hypothetical protein